MKEKDTNEVFRDSLLYKISIVPSVICIGFSAYTMYYTWLSLIGEPKQSLFTTIVWSILVDIFPLLGISVLVQMYAANFEKGKRKDFTPLMNGLAIFIFVFQITSLSFSLFGSRQQIEITTGTVAEPKFDEFMKTQNNIINTAAAPIHEQNHAQTIADLIKRKNRILDFNGNYEGWHKGNSMKKSAQKQVDAIDSQIANLQKAQKAESEKAQNIAKEQARKTEALLKSNEKLQSVVLDNYEKRKLERESEVSAKSFFYAVFVVIIWLAGNMITGMVSFASAKSKIASEQSDFSEKSKDKAYLSTLFLSYARAKMLESPDLEKSVVYELICERFINEGLEIPMQRPTFYQKTKQ